CSPFRAPLGGSRSGKRCSTTRIRRSSVRGRSTWDRPRGTTCHGRRGSRQDLTVLPARGYMKLAAAAFAALLACAAQPVPSTPKFDGARAFEDLKQQVALGPRPAGSPALQRTRDYIKKQLVAA